MLKKYCSPFSVAIRLGQIIIETYRFPIENVFNRVTLDIKARFIYNHDGRKEEHLCREFKDFVYVNSELRYD